MGVFNRRSKAADKRSGVGRKKVTGNVVLCPNCGGSSVVLTTIGGDFAIRQRCCKNANCGKVFMTKEVVVE